MNEGAGSAEVKALERAGWIPVCAKIALGSRP
jgi:hypothetical protein